MWVIYLENARTRAKVGDCYLSLDGRCLLRLRLSCTAVVEVARADATGSNALSSSLLLQCWLCQGSPAAAAHVGYFLVRTQSYIGCFMQIGPKPEQKWEIRPRTSHIGGSFSFCDLLVSVGHALEQRGKSCTMHTWMMLASPGDVPHACIVGLLFMSTPCNPPRSETSKIFENLIANKLAPLLLGGSMSQGEQQKVTTSLATEVLKVPLAKSRSGWPHGFFFNRCRRCRRKPCLFCRKRP